MIILVDVYLIQIWIYVSRWLGLIHIWIDSRAYGEHLQWIINKQGASGQTCDPGSCAWLGEQTTKKERSRTHSNWFKREAATLMQKHSASGMTEALGRVTQNTKKGERELHKAVLVGNQTCQYLITVRSTSPIATFRVRGKAPPPPWRHAVSRAPPPTGHNSVLRNRPAPTSTMVHRDRTHGIPTSDSGPWYSWKAKYIGVEEKRGSNPHLRFLAQNQMHYEISSNVKSVTSLSLISLALASSLKLLHLH